MLDRMIKPVGWLLFLACLPFAYCIRIPPSYV